MITFRIILNNNKYNLERIDLNILNLVKKKLETEERIIIEENYKKYLTERINDIKLLSSEVEKLLEQLKLLIINYY